jgi:hypothetical protein
MFLYCLQSSSDLKNYQAANEPTNTCLLYRDVYIRSRSFAEARISYVKNPVTTYCHMLTCYMCAFP